MQRPTALVLLSLLACIVGPGARAECTDSTQGLPVSRIVEIDASTGPLFGAMSKFTREESFLAPKEVVLTFDDGPLPAVTNPILDALDRYCTKATFFWIGQMALAYPSVVKDVIARGHTVGAHTWSHPMSLPRREFGKATDEIDKGFAAVALAAGQPIAPFFRFPGLNDSNPLLAHLQTRGVASFTVDVVSNDSYIASPQRLTERVIREVTRKQGGILLFHDIKKSTAKALPDILAWLKTNGYSVVHIRPKAPMPAIAGYEDVLAPILAKARPVREQHQLVPASVEPAAATELVVAKVTLPEPAVTSLAPAAQQRAAPPTVAKAEPAAPEPKVSKRRGHADASHGSTRAKSTALRRKKRLTETQIGL